ncbi:DUF3515 domain-containing protein [Kribbella sp. NPDC051620]|uniref:DUF3515 domain-containing protein n=1 Tax=Kribbella sp. NPDC051620 TaxID=3364120 RepID=UPI003787EFBB
MPRRPHLIPIAVTPGRRGRSRVALAVVVLGLTLTGCSPGPVEIAVPSPAPEVADACTALIQAMPAKVLDAKRRKAEPASPLTTAYGDPAIEVTCGVAPPAGMAQAQSQCFEVNGVGWYAQQVTNGYLFTTIGRKVYLELAVPSKYAPEANALTDVSDAVKAHNTLITPCT